MVNKKIVFPLHFKLLIIFSLLMGTALTTHFYFSSQAFKDDKIGFIYETALTRSESMAHQVDNYFNQVVKDTKFFADNFSETNTKILESAFLNQKEISALYILNLQDLKRVYQISLASTADMWSEVESKIQFLKDETYSDEKNKTTVLPGIMPGQVFVAGLTSQKQGFVAILNIENLQKALEGDDSFFNTVANLKGDVLFNNFKNESGVSASLVKDFIGRIVGDNGTFMASSQGQEYLVSFQKLHHIDFVAFTYLSSTKALSSIDQMVYQSFYLGGISFFACLILIFIFAKWFTSPVKSLLQNMQSFSDGEMDERSSVKNSDEIGLIANQFNSMADKIQQHLIELAQKYRIESEVKVVEHLQRNFLPAESEKVGSLDFFGKIIPASECGGDWWGHFDFNGKVVFAVGDATGHGLGAAMATASLHTSFFSLKYILNQFPTYIDHPQKMVEFINQGIMVAKGQYYITFFLGVFDPVKNVINYAMAGHLPPLVMTPTSEKITRKNFVPVKVGLSSPLGKEPFVCSPGQVELQSGQTLIMMTDGLPEAEGKDNKVLGSGGALRMMASAFQVGEMPKVYDSIFEQFNSFLGDKKLNDDVTCVLVSNRN